MTDQMRVPLLEICTDSPAGAAAAIAGGCDRIELCAALDLGGLTPSAGLTDAVVQIACEAGVPVFGMVRPRPGDFAYDAGELALAIAEATSLLDAGVDGLVFGTCVEGVVDVATARLWIEAVRDHAGRAVPCTFHRAIDLTADPVTAVDSVAALGFDRILTSGGAVRALDGADTIRAMAARAGSRIAVMAGSGVDVATAAALAGRTGLSEFHASARRGVGTVDARLRALGFATRPPRSTDAATVRAIGNALRETIATV